MNILLTGGTGYIGSHTAVELAQKNHTVILYDNLSNSFENVVEKVRHITGKPIAFVNGDIHDRSSLISCLKTFTIDAVLHFAGYKAVGESAEFPLKYFENNISGSINLLSCMNEVGVKNLIFSSSATVYGHPHYLPYDELHPTNPSNVYGRTKLQIEEMLRELAERQNEWQIISLRYFNPIGAHSSGLIGDNPTEVPSNIMPCLNRVASGQIEKFTIFGDDFPTKDGTAARDYVHIEDLALGHALATKLLGSLDGYLPLNLGTGHCFTVLEIIRAFEGANNLRIPFTVGPRRKGDLAEFYADSSKSQKLLSWKPQRNLSDMCRDSFIFEQFINAGTSGA